MQLTSHQAQAVVDGAEAKARELGLPVIIAVLDSGAHLKAFRRMDGAVLGSIDIAIRKAKTAVLFQTKSENVWEYCKPGAPAPARATDWKCRRHRPAGPTDLRRSHQARSVLARAATALASGLSEGLRRRRAAAGDQVVAGGVVPRPAWPRQ